MKRVLLVLACCLTACGSDPPPSQKLAIRIPSDKRLLAGVSTLSLRAERDGVVLAQQSFPATTTSISLDGITLGDRTIFTLDGLSSLSDLVARGRSCPVSFTGNGPPISIYFAPVNFFGLTPTSPIAVRRGAIALTLADGDVLVAGGADPTTMMPTPLASAELFSPTSATFALAETDELSQPRDGAQVAEVPGVGALVLGGRDASGSMATGAEIFTISASGFTSVPDPTQPMVKLGRIAHRMVTQADGSIRVTGGIDDTGTTLKQTLLVSILSPTQITVTTGPNTSAPDLNVARHDHAMVIAAGGVPVVIGGYDQSNTPLASIEALTPSGWEHIADLQQPRAEMTATLLDDGTILVVGGIGAGLQALDTAEVFNPVTRTTRLVKMAGPRHGHTATSLGGGRVLVVGGGTDVQDTPLDTVELYSSDIGEFVAERPLGSPRYGHVAVPLCDGTVLVVGGDLPKPGFGPTAEIYTPPAR